MKKTFLAGLAVGVMMLGMAGMASASPITNGNFETGDFTGWSISTIEDGSAGIVSSNGSLAAATITSAQISQSFSWVDNEELSFDWAFTYNDWGTPYNDYAYFGVTDSVGGGSFTTILAQTASAPWQSYAHTFTGSGSGTLFFGANDVGDQVVNSVGYFDNISTNAASVPEPITMLLMGTGLAGLIAVRRKMEV